MKILALNAGSNSLKFEIVAAGPQNAGFGRSLLSGSYDDIGKPQAAFSLWEGKQIRSKQPMEIADHGRAAELLFDWIEQGGAKGRGIAAVSDIDRVAHRVVHGADRFRARARITPEVVRQIEELEDLAPLHNARALQVIRAAEAKVGPRVPAIAVFDTVFHQTIPDEAALYPLPLDLTRRSKIRRYGFHGISHRYLMLRYAEIAGRAPEDLNLVTLHLEGGSSIAAIRRGQSVDTSMGFTPLEGLMMGTRSGDIDPAIVIYLMRKEKLASDAVERVLNKESGLLGVSGFSGDTRELVKQLSHPRADLALNMFCYRVRKYIGAYLAVLNGADAIVFGGGIGENTPLVRERICEHFAYCGIDLDRERNRELIDREGAITTPDSSIPIWMIPTQEGLMMAREAAKQNPDR